MNELFDNATMAREDLTPGGFAMSVAMTNCGAAGWVSDRTGYRYDLNGPVLARSSQDRYLLLVRSRRPEQIGCVIGYPITSSAASRRISSWPVGEIDGAWSGPLSSSFCAVHSLASSRVSRN